MRHEKQKPTRAGRPRSGRVAVCVRVSEEDLALLAEQARTRVPKSSPSTLASEFIAVRCEEMRRSRR